MNFENMECSINYTHECSILLSSIVMTMLVFMISTFIIVSSVYKRTSNDESILLNETSGAPFYADACSNSCADSSCADSSCADSSCADSSCADSCDSDDSGKSEQKYDEKPERTRKRTNRYLDMDFLTHGQKIRYVYENRECLGLYNSKIRMFVNEKGKTFETPSAFAKNHLLEMKMKGKMKSERETFQVNGWTDCECEVDGMWVTLDEYVHNLKKFLLRC
jgi:hypothetical protein